MGVEMELKGQVSIADVHLESLFVSHTREFPFYF